MKKTVILSALVLFAAACSDSPSDSFGSGFQQEFTKEFRKGFIDSATERCIAKVPKTSLLSEDMIRQVCTCTAEKMADRVSTDDMPAVLSGNISEKLKEQIKQSTAECLKETAGYGKNASDTQ